MTIQLWTESIKEYCSKHDCKYKVPRKGTPMYTEVKKIYERKKKSSKSKSKKK